MKCEICQELLRKLVSGQIENVGEDVQDHLMECSICTKFAENLIGAIDLYLQEEVEPPNADLMWQKISLAIKNEPPKSLWSRLWTFSFGQMVAGIAVIAIFSSLLTAVIFVNFTRKTDLQGRQTAPSLAEKILARVGILNSPEKEREQRLKEHQQAIEYWSQKIQQRRHQWNKNLQEVFDRNLEEIDKVVAEYKKNLEENPYDEISGEMLDTAMKEKLELLREFAEL